MSRTVTNERNGKFSTSWKDDSACAEAFCAAIKKLAACPANLENLESYLSQHFDEWLAKYARTPEELTAEMKNFAEMRI